MSNPEGKGDQPERAALLALEEAVGQAVGRLAELRARAEEAEARSEEYGTLLKRFTEDGAEAGRMLTRMANLESENADLRDRLQRGREGVERMLARLRFLEGQR